MGHLAAFMSVVNNYDEQYQELQVKDKQEDEQIDGTLANFKDSSDQEDMINNIMFGLDDYVQNEIPNSNNDLNKK